MTEGQNPEGHACPQWNWTKAFQLSVCCVCQKCDGLFSFPCCCHTLVNQLVNYSLCLLCENLCQELWPHGLQPPPFLSTPSRPERCSPRACTHWPPDRTHCPATHGGQTSTYVCIWEYVMQERRQCMSVRSRDKCMIVHVCVWKPFRCWQWRMEMKRSRTPGT